MHYSRPATPYNSYQPPFYSEYCGWNTCRGGFDLSLWTGTFLASAMKIYTLNCMQCTQSHQLFFALSPCYLLELLQVKQSVTNPLEIQKLSKLTIKKIQVLLSQWCRLSSICQFITDYRVFVNNNEKSWCQLRNVSRPVTP